jgi:hypothetical protein
MWGQDIRITIRVAAGNARGIMGIAARETKTDADAYGDCKNTGRMGHVRKSREMQRSKLATTYPGVQRLFMWV